MARLIIMASTYNFMVESHIEKLKALIEKYPETEPKENYLELKEK